MVVGADGGPRVAVVGAGVVGLTAAHELAAAGYHVDVFARDAVEATTSAVAGAVWYPFLAEPRDRVLGWAAESYRRLRQLANVAGSGVRMCEAIELFGERPVEPWWREAVPVIEWLDSEQCRRRWGASYAAALATLVPVCDAPRHLAWLVAALARYGVVVQRRRLGSFAELSDRADVVVNCTGLGARELCGDRTMRAVRGQVLRFAGGDGASDVAGPVVIDDGGDRPVYLIPREHELVAGGSADFDDEDRSPRECDTAAILRLVRRLRPSLIGREPAAVAVGLRPFRPTVRLEIEPASAVMPPVVHDYGHGGSGFTIAWGCAAEVVRLVESLA